MHLEEIWNLSILVWIQEAPLKRFLTWNKISCKWNQFGEQGFMGLKKEKVH